MTAAARRAATPVDQNISWTTQSYAATRVYHCNGNVLRVTVQVDAYLAQSYSKVEVLNADRKWTVLATGPALDRLDADVLSPYARNKGDNAVWASRVGDTADALIVRAVAILG